MYFRRSYPHLPLIYMNVSLWSFWYNFSLFLKPELIISGTGVYIMIYDCVVRHSIICQIFRMVLKNIHSSVENWMLLPLYDRTN